MRALATWALAVLGVLALLTVDATQALAERRVALVIGNSPYQHMAALKNPSNDASDMAAALRGLGFEVMERPNVERKDVRELLKDFSRLLAGADSAVVYYAGHALEYRGQYYLVPIDAALEDADALKYDMLSVADLRDLLGRVRGLRMMILDACRNDPLDTSAILSPEAARAVRRAELERSLSGARGGQGMVVAYATAPFDIEEDGTARNSPFTRAFLKWIKEPELEVRPLFQRVSREVFDETKGRQIPEISVALRGDYVLNRTESHHSAWLRIHRSSDLRDFQDFIGRFPHSEHRPQAERRLEMLERAARLVVERLEEQRLAESRQARCADEMASVAAARDDRDTLLRLKAAARCVEQSGPAVDAALAVVAAREDLAQKAALAEREARIRRAAEEQAEREKVVHLALCGEEAAKVTMLSGDRKGLQGLEATARCPERTNALVAAALSAIADRERQKAEQERQATLSAHRQQEELCRAEAARIKAAASAENAEDHLADLRDTLKCPQSAQLLAIAANEAQAAARMLCAQEQQQLAALGTSDQAALTAFARTARCTDVARTAQAQADRIDAEHARVETLCSHDESELDRLRSLGSAGRMGLEQLQFSTACERLKPLVVAALGVPLPPPAPAVNTPAQLRRAVVSLRLMGCLAGTGDDLPLAAVRGGLRKYFDARGVQSVSLDVDEDLLRQLGTQAQTRVCPLDCGDGEVQRQGRCVPERKRQPPRQQSRPRPEPEAPPAAQPERRAPPVASSGPVRRAPTIILGN